VTEAGFCGVCGWPSKGASVCEACEAPVATTPGAARDETNVWILGGPRAEDYPDLKNAFLAWKQKDWPRMVGQCLVALGVESPQITNLPDGPGWSFSRDSAAIYVALDKARGELAIEAPMVRLPVRQRVPLLRTLLELNESALGAARFCLRGDLVLLRFAEQMENLAPPKLVAAIRELALRADQLDDLLSVGFSAPMVGPEAQKQRLPWSLLGSPRKLKHLQGADAPPLPPPAAAVAPTIGAGSVSDGIEARLRNADALCDLLSAAAEIAKPLQFMQDVHPAIPLLLQRALLFRVFDQFRATCPDAVAMLMRAGEPVYAQFWELPTGLLAVVGGTTGTAATPLPIGLDLVVGHVIATRAQVPSQAPCAPAAFASAAEAKTMLRKYLAEVDKGPKDAKHRHFVLLGALAELLTRTRLPEATAARLRQVMSEGAQRGPNPEATSFLLQELKGLSG
jgi:hypothetical protein